MDPIIAKIAVSIYTGLSKGLIEALHRSVRKKFQWPEKEKAIDRCLKAGVEALCFGLERFAESEQLRMGELLKTFFDDNDTVRELSFLLIGKEIDRDHLWTIFSELAGEDGVPKTYNFDAEISRFEETFIDIAAGEKELVDSLIFGETRKQTRIQKKKLEETRAQTRIQENMDRSLDKLANAGERQEQTARQRYLDSLARDYLKLPLAALSDELPGKDAITLDQVYIELDTTASIAVDKEGKPVADPKRDKKPDELENRPLRALEAAKEHTRLVLLGDPGSGKSTFVKNLCALLAQGKAAEGFSDKLLPVFIQLRDLTTSLSALDLTNLSASNRQASLSAALRTQVADELIRLEVPEFIEPLCHALRDGLCLLVLDGLDEVPFHQRGLIRETVQAIIGKYHPERLIITCRIRSFDEGKDFPEFRAYTLAPFDSEKIKKFVKGWYDAPSGPRLTPEERRQKIDKLSAAALSGELNKIAGNPMLLTTMAVIHQRDIGLPDKRVELYNLAVDVLVRRWRKYNVGEILTPSEKLNDFLKDDRKLRAALEGLAYEAHDRERDPKKAGDLERLRALDILHDPRYLPSTGLAEEFLNYIDQKSGLLTGRGGSLDKPVSYGFPHRTFQEYLAGCHLVSRRDMEKQIIAKAAEGEYWSIAIQLGFEELLYNRRGENTLLNLAYHLCAVEQADDITEERCHLWSSNIAVLLGRDTIKADTHLKIGGKAYLDRLRQSLIMRLSGQLPFGERAEAARNLARLGELDSLKIPPVYALRASEETTESGAAENMVKKLGFFDASRHSEGKGCIHIYEKKSFNGQTVVLDHATALMWQQPGSDSIKYDEAQSYVKKLREQKFAGFDDWRLPTLEEAMSLMEPEKKNGDCYIDPVFDVTQWWIWTSDRDSASEAWSVDFLYGYCVHSRVGFNLYVRAVRSAGNHP